MRGLFQARQGAIYSRVIHRPDEMTGSYSQTMNEDDSPEDR